VEPQREEEEQLLVRTAVAAISLVNAPNPNQDELFKYLHSNNSYNKQDSDSLIRLFGKTTERFVPK
jgi:hypothetical protein